jgi:hypothetical protein
MDKAFVRNAGSSDGDPECRNVPDRKPLPRPVEVVARAGGPKQYYVFAQRGGDENYIALLTADEAEKIQASIDAILQNGGRVHLFYSVSYATADGIEAMLAS